MSSQALEIENATACPGTARPQMSLAGQGTLRLKVFSEIPEDIHLREQWNTLALAVDHPQVFYTYEWALAVQRAYQASLRPLLFFIYNSSEILCGIAALATDVSGKHASFLCSTTGDYCDFLSVPEYRDGVVALVLRELKSRGIEEIVLTNLPAESATVDALANNSRRNKLFTFARPAYQCAQISLAKLDRRKDDSSLLPRKKMLRRFLNAMGREHPVGLEHIRSWSQIEPVLSQFMHSHVGRFLATGRISNIARPERRAFLVELSKLLSEPGWLALTRMTSGDRVLAWNYGFQFQGTWFWYQPTFDTNLEKYSPGFCLLAKMVEDAVSEGGVHTVDLGLGAEEYKERFANQFRPTLWLSFTSSRARHLATILRYRVGESIKKHSSVERIFRSSRHRYQAFRRRLQDSGVFATSIWVGKRALRSVAARDEILFYELSQNEFKALAPDDMSLKPIDLDLLASAAMQYSEDAETMSYLIRCARRLSSNKSCKGLALTDRNANFLHFIWAQPFEGFFLSELHASVPSPSSNSMIFFDAWTPAAQRGRGFYAQTLSRVVPIILQDDKRAWIFSSSSNSASLKGLKNAGCRPSFSVFRYHLLGWEKIVQRNAVMASPPRIEGL